MLFEKRLVLSVIFGHLSTFYQLEFEFGDRKFFARGTFPRIHTIVDRHFHHYFLFFSFFLFNFFSILRRDLFS